MKEDERLEQRLQKFYEQVPDVEDALPFKDYLLKHEDSRMAWYLLGKQYAARGETAKANYCFHQAGEIYEAFESRPAPEVLAATHDRPRRRNAGRIVLIACVLLLVLAGLVIPAWQASAPELAARDGDNADKTKGRAAVRQLSSQDPASASPANVPESTPMQQTELMPAFIAATAIPAGNQALGAWFQTNDERSPHLLVQSKRVGMWQDWLTSGKPIASIHSGSPANDSGIRWYDPAWCDCEPSDATPVAQQIADWKPLQEEKIVLVSAIRHYRARMGMMPGDPADLAGSYPGNHMAGWSPAMDGWLQQLLTLQAESPIAPDWPQGTGDPSASLSYDAMPSGEWQDLTMHPLEIIVDKSNHRLAVVSGRVLLRNYAVGLGGERTPEGEFVISEKVRNPNGVPEGVFGTRGMTLSDTRYGIHGTNEPDSIGKDESLGCIRMWQEDVEELYDLVPLGTKVTIVDGGLPSDIRVPPVRFRLPQPQTQDETNPGKVYDWLG
jgi:hypothetical protein